MEKKIRILVAKAGLDGHDRGAKVVASFFRDAGFEVIYSGLRQTPQMIVQTALQEDVDVIAISMLSGAHMTVFPRVLQLMKENNMNDVLLTGGGIMSDEDIQKLQEMGVGRLFGPGSSLHEAVAYVREWYEKTKGAKPEKENHD
ncbi:cobalamin B12-binding domain-containing protein [Caldithrix abyssi]|uniref:Methylmalonyl-CoA mutase domain-containing protein n=1 Tax=Caldithrix abyssi DSM 13497 TaxID=880073 RepID=H1XT54_CALAY|nr:cobalamin B12-binding domain-containing protein [Caldithrix abyssi]APF18633.1 methylmalonyl-CoA mutase, C-terminal domain [Caldithrix abyssi DSM 13497]EHO42621.1 Methylmalonyl-CoA mutase domain-containing protein [Caldithrix abyssi DSM 13497]